MLNRTSLYDNAFSSPFFKEARKAIATKLITTHLDFYLISKDLKNSYVNGVLNKYADALQISPIEDASISQCNGDILNKLHEKFKRDFFSTLNLEAILNYFILQFTLTTLKTKLENYGQDTAFNWNDVFLPNKKTAFTWKAKYVIRLTLINRLIQSGYLPSELDVQIKIPISFGSSLVYFRDQTLKMAYIETIHNKKISFIPYCIDVFSQEEETAKKQTLLHVILGMKFDEQNEIQAGICEYLKSEESKNSPSRQLLIDFVCTYLNYPNTFDIKKESPLTTLNKPGIAMVPPRQLQDLFKKKITIKTSENSKNSIIRNNNVLHLACMKTTPTTRAFGIAQEALLPEQLNELIRAKNSAGKTPLDIASERKLKNIENILLESLGRDFSKERLTLVQLRYYNYKNNKFFSMLHWLFFTSSKSIELLGKISNEKDRVIRGKLATDYIKNHLDKSTLAQILFEVLQIPSAQIKEALKKEKKEKVKIGQSCCFSFFFRTFPSKTYQGTINSHNSRECRPLLLN